MTRRLSATALVAFLGLGAGAGAALAADLVHHRMGIILDEETHGLIVSTEITLPETMADGDIEFLLNSALRVEASCMAMGQAVGAAAALGAKQGIPSRDVPLEDIRALLSEHGAIVPGTDAPILS